MQTKFLRRFLLNNQDYKTSHGLKEGLNWVNRAENEPLGVKIESSRRKINRKKNSGDNNEMILKF